MVVLRSVVGSCSVVGLSEIPVAYQSKFASLNVPLPVDIQKKVNLDDGLQEDFLLPLDDTGRVLETEISDADHQKKVDELIENKSKYSTRLEFVNEIHKVLLEKLRYLRIYKSPAEFYYSLSLKDRAELICAPSPKGLLKTLVFHNTKDPLDDHYYVSVVPYSQKLNTAMLESEFRGFHMRLYGSQPSRKKFHLRMVKDIEQQTGYQTGGVNPFGLHGLRPAEILTRKEYSIKPYCMGIICESVLEISPPRFYMGGGTADYHIEALLTKDTIEHLLPQFTIAKVSNLREDNFEDDKAE